MFRHMRVSHSLLRVLLLAAMVLGLVLPAAAVAQAPEVKGDVGLTDVTQPTVAVAPTTAGVPAKYTIGFTTSSTLSIGGTVTVVFPSGVSTGSLILNTTMTDDGAGVALTTVQGTATTTVVVIVGAQIIGGSAVVLEFAVGANIVNPAAGVNYTLTVQTSAETQPVTSATYTIVAAPVLPTVASVAPPAANRGETLPVVIRGGYFTPLTAVNFGPNIAVSVIASTTDVITATIAIATGAITGTRTVTVTTPSGSGTGTFTVKAAGTPWVDRYNSAMVYQANYSSITAATNAVTVTNDILIAHAATYTTTVETFPILVDVQGLTIKSYMGASSTIIDSVNAGKVLDITANNVTIGGSGFTIKGKGAVANGLIAVLAGSGTTIEGNDIVGDYYLMVTSNGVSSLNVKDNSFLAYATVTNNETTAVYVNNSLSSSIFQGNSFPLGDGTTTQHVDSGIYVEGADAVTFNNNTFEGMGTRVYGGASKGCAGIELGAVQNITVTNNTLHCNVGIWFEGSDLPGTGNIKIYKNDISSNVWGIEILSGTLDPTDVITILYNNIVGNTEWGILNSDASLDVSAKKNWWGSEGGPSAGSGLNASAALGNGDEVSADVLFDPWLTEDYATTIASQKRYYGSQLDMSNGWNTLSTPLDLKAGSGGKTFGDIQALGSFLDPWVIAWSFNAQTQLWELALTSTELVPGKGFYIKFSSATRFPILYNGVMGFLPEYPLYQGFNLIGSMFGVDTDYGIAAVGVGTKPVDIALASVADVASVVISPALPGQVASWGTTVANPAPAKNMIVGEAYWLYVNASGRSLAGFEVTPLFFDPCVEPGC